jgi:Zn finger protein HypA/HybF involved in hydrogenase expression
MEDNKKMKRKVKCEKCGLEWETQAPFIKTMCPGCHEQTNIAPPEPEKK